MAISLKQLGIALGAILLAILLVWGSVQLANALAKSNVGITGPLDTANQITVAPWVASYLFPLLGISSANTTIAYGTLVLHLAVFLLIFIALAEIVMMFSSFSEGASYLIALGLAIIGGVTGIYQIIVASLGLTAAIGGVGVAIILIGAILAAISLNWGVTGWVRKWRLRRQAEISSFKTMKTAKSVGNAIKALSQIEKDLAGLP